MIESQAVSICMVVLNHAQIGSQSSVTTGVREPSHRVRASQAERLLITLSPAPAPLRF